MYKILWKIFKKGLLKEYLKETNKPVNLSQLSYAFSDASGRKYYRFPENVSLPFDRFGKLMEFLTLINARLTKQNINEILDAALKIIQEGIGKEKNAAKVAALMYQLKERDGWIVPHQLIYDVVCLQYIREDENPGQFDQDIHMQKVDTFMAENQLNTFFLQSSELKKVFNSINMSEAEWREYCRKSAEELTIQRELLKTILSKK